MVRETQKPPGKSPNENSGLLSTCPTLMPTALSAAAHGGLGGLGGLASAAGAAGGGLGGTIAMPGKSSSVK